MEPLLVIHIICESPKIFAHICHRMITVQAKYQRAPQFGNSNTLFAVAEVRMNIWNTVKMCVKCQVLFMELSVIFQHKGWGWRVRM